MKTVVFNNPKNHREEISLIGYRPDDIYILGMLAEKLPYAQKGLSIDGKISLHVSCEDLIEAALEKKYIQGECC